MARPYVADGEDGLQIWMVAANVFHKQSRTANKEWSSSLVVGRGATISLTVRNKLVVKCHKGPRTWVDSLEKLYLSLAKWI
jgi:hypothetical protein